MHGDCVLPEWLEAGIDPALRNNDEDASALLPPAQSIASVAVPRPSGSTGITPVALTPTSSTPVHNTKEDWRDLNKFYASDSEPESGSSEDEDNHEDSGNNNGEQSNDDGDDSDNESGEEIDRKSQ